MMSIIAWLLRLGLAVVFVYAGAMKLADPAGFAEEIKDYRLVPAVVAPWGALYLPWLEIVVGLAVLIPRTARAAALIQAGLMAVFTVALMSAWYRGLDITCGCFGGGAGGGKPTNYLWLIGRDLVLLLAAAWIAYGLRKSGGPNQAGYCVGEAASGITSEAASP